MIEIDCESIEATRERFRPETITTLFIGESAPHNGTFFYRGENSMLREMRRAMEKWKGQSFGSSDEFLETFKALGWYLDDLVLCPVNNLLKPERRARCSEAVESLKKRIERNKPQAIVVLLLGIVPFVERAARAAGCTVNLYPVPFPGMGQQERFRSEMATIIGGLPVAQQISN